MGIYKIADINIELDFPEWLIHDRLETFKSSQKKADSYYRVTFCEAPPAPTDKIPFMLKAYADSFYDCNGFLHIRNYEKTDIPSYSLISGDWSDCTLYIDPIFHNQDSDTDYIRDSLLSQLRDLFIPLLIRNSGVLTHSVSIDLNGKAVLFSAPTGTGKTTHVNLWKEKYGVQILDGDITACRMHGGTPYAYGLPWCGSSGEFSNKRLPLKSVVFLEQGKINEISKLDAAEAIIRLYARSFLYLSDEAVVDQVLKTIQSLVGQIDCYLLKCRPDFEAVELVKKCLEKD